MRRHVSIMAPTRIPQHHWRALRPLCLGGRKEKRKKARKAGSQKSDGRSEPPHKGEGERPGAGNIGKTQENKRGNSLKRVQSKSFLKKGDLRYDNLTIPALLAL